MTKLQFRLGIVSLLAPAMVLACGGLIAWIARGEWPAWALWFTLTAFTVLSGLAVHWFVRNLEHDLRETAQNADRIGRGDANSNIPFLERPIELTALSVSLQRMVGSMRQRQTELEVLNNVLDEGLRERTQDITAIVDIGHRLGTMQDLRSLSEDILGELQKTLDYRSASIWLREQNRVVLAGFRAPGIETPSDVLGLPLSGQEAKMYAALEKKRQAMTVNDSKRSFFDWLWAQVVQHPTTRLYENSKSWMMLPLVVHDQLIGALRVDHIQAHYFSPERERLLNAVTNQIALAVGHAQLLAQAEQVAVIAERNRIARDLHDAVSQTLFAANIVAGTVFKTFERDPEAARAQLEDLQQLNRGALAELRMLLFELRPDALEHAKLGELLRHLVDSGEGRGQMRVSLNLEQEPNLPGPAKVELYRIAQEAFNNISKHSHAKHVIITLRGTNESCELLINDDGQGFDPNKTPGGHFGLENMHSRARDIGAVTTINSSTGQGTSVQVIWPVEDGKRNTWTTA
jgi:signal transduction histidine kinase